MSPSRMLGRDQGEGAPDDTPHMARFAHNACCEGAPEAGHGTLLLPIRDTGQARNGRLNSGSADVMGQGVGRIWWSGTHLARGSSIIGACSPKEHVLLFALSWAVGCDDMRSWLPLWMWKYHSHMQDRPSQRPEPAVSLGQVCL